jgi:hypothetical protein
MSQTHFIHSHTTVEILLDHQGILCQSMALLTLVCAQNCLVATVLTKALSPCVAKIIQAWNEFPDQERWSPGATAMRHRDTSPSGKGLLSTSLEWNYSR